MPWIDKKPIKQECPHKGLPPLRGGVDFAEGSVYACDDCGEEFVYLIKFDIPVWDKAEKYKQKEKPKPSLKYLEDLKKTLPKLQPRHVNEFNRLEGLPRTGV